MLSNAAALPHLQLAKAVATLGTKGSLMYPTIIYKRLQTIKLNLELQG